MEDDLKGDLISVTSGHILFIFESFCNNISNEDYIQWKGEHSIEDDVQILKGEYLLY